MKDCPLWSLVCNRETNDEFQHTNELNTLLESKVRLLLSNYAADTGQTEARELITRPDTFLPADVKHKLTPIVVKLHHTTTTTLSNYNIHNSNLIGVEPLVCNDICFACYYIRPFK